MMIIINFTFTIIDKYTPATTIVEECNNDDTGVGPSIATGNQYIYKYIELLEMIDNKQVYNNNSLLTYKYDIMKK